MNFFIVFTNYNKCLQNFINFMKFFIVFTNYNKCLQKS
jgi:hypothetical protein